MFKTIQKTFGQDSDLPQRAFTLEMRKRVLEGSIYDNLQYAFNEEKNGANEYIPLRERRPSVRYNVCRLVVDDSVSLLFSEGHFPQAEFTDEATRDNIARLIKEIGLNEVMIDAATRGSAGSVAILMRVLKNRVFLKVMETAMLTPTWQSDAPDALESVTERYKAKGADLKESGYSVSDDDLDADFWFQRDWNAESETWYLPIKVADQKEGKTPQIDSEKTITHSLGFVPIAWIKNLPGGDDIDGQSTFSDDAINISIEIDYQLSQGGRGLKYSSDPTLLLKEPAMGQNGEIVKGGGNALVVGKDGDAKMLEINGTAVQAVMDYVSMLRELAIESMHGNRTSADKISAAQSGRAMELMNQAMIWLADKLRISYGEGALVDLIAMICAASEKMKLVFKDQTPVGKLNADGLALRWPDWYQPTASDRQSDATTLRVLTDAGIVSNETATRTIAQDYDIEDIDKERKLIAAEMAERNANAQVQVKIAE